MSSPEFVAGLQINSPRLARGFSCLLVSNTVRSSSVCSYRFRCVFIVFQLMAAGPFGTIRNWSVGWSLSGPPVERARLPLRTPTLNLAPLRRGFLFRSVSAYC